MNKIRVKCPAKINLTLEVVNKREDGFHNINSVMQLISLYDYIELELFSSENTDIVLSGNSDKIPYDKTNLVYKAADLFFNETGIKSGININIEKHIPIAAGLAGGSTDGAGTFLGLNKLFNNPLSKEKLHTLCAKLGSDLNVCLEGGCLKATMRGEKVEKLPFSKYPVTLIKPKNLGISAKEAYTKYSLMETKPKFNNTGKLINSLKNNKNIRQYLYNDLERAVFDDYKELQLIKQRLPESVMSGSGPTYFILDNIDETIFNNDYEVIKNLEFIPNGVETI